MKTIEQKALAYDEAIEKIKYVMEHGVQPVLNKEDLQEIFPELKESENERIRKEIVRFIQMEVEDEIVGNKWIAWLKKQKVLTIEEDIQGKEDVLWCIKQAKKYAKDENEMGTCWFAEQWLEKQGEKPQGKSALEAIKEKPTDNANKVASAWSYEDEANLNNIIWLCNNCIKGSETTWIPSQATKIKHLIETIKEKGLAQQNPAWSEEDERERKRIIGLLEGWLLTFKETCYAEDCECGIVWLKSLKQRIGG